ncbi:hypothetical protein [Spirillospora albida]|uniref:hypothetical protein n=1 Tax=Spirillospora albida TaxID=58123 RepID=UPI0004C1ADAB|nr:hypothetical protein [Spirillospora albida]
MLTVAGCVVRPTGGSTLVVDVTGERKDWTRTALAQVACTAEALPGVRRVVVRGNRVPGR